MIELTATIVISVSSILLLCYWFHYMCRLILSTVTSQDYATIVAQAHQLAFQDARRQLTQRPTELDRLKDMLDRDYAVLARLLSQVEDTQAGIERRMLAIHYRLASLVYRASGQMSASAAHQALEQMSDVVIHLANRIGEATASSATA